MCLVVCLVVCLAECICREHKVSDRLNAHNSEVCPHSSSSRNYDIQIVPEELQPALTSNVMSHQTVRSPQNFGSSFKKVGFLCVPGTDHNTNE